MIRYSPLPAPVLLSPVADQILCVGSTATFAANPIGAAPFAFRWQRDGVDIPGATCPELHVACDEAADGARFRVVVRNEYGETRSNEAVLRVARGDPEPTESATRWHLDPAHRGRSLPNAPKASAGSGRVRSISSSR